MIIPGDESNMESIDYDALKKKGFLRAKQEGYFILRTRIAAGNYTKDQLKAISRISEEFGRGFVHLTVRQGIEVPFIKFSDIPEVERQIKAAGIELGTSGPCLRATTSCPGNNWCKRGLVDTFSLFKRIEEELGFRCGFDLPHKFKIAISGCPNTCTRAQGSEIGIHGQVDISHPNKRIGYTVYLGGCGGRTPHEGLKLDRILTEDEVLSAIEKVVTFYKKNAKPRQRLALLIEEKGKHNFLKEIGEAKR
jgi:dissimilatory sulfite reductase (desulfoviridin) alpha/beta subunit